MMIIMLMIMIIMIKMIRNKNICFKSSDSLIQNLFTLFPFSFPSPHFRFSFSLAYLIFLLLNSIEVRDKLL